MTTQTYIFKGTYGTIIKRKMLNDFRKMILMHDHDPLHLMKKINEDLNEMVFMIHV